MISRAVLFLVSVFVVVVVSLVAVLTRGFVGGSFFFFFFFLLLLIANFRCFYFIDEFLRAAPDTWNRHTSDTRRRWITRDVFVRIQLKCVRNFDVLDDNHAFLVIRFWRVGFRFCLSLCRGDRGSFRFRFLSLHFLFVNVDIRDELHLFLRHTVRFDAFWHVLRGDGIN